MRPFLTCLLLVAATTAHAQVLCSLTEFQVEIFEPQPAQGANLLNSVKSDVLQHLYLSFGVFAHYVEDLLELLARCEVNQDIVLSRLVESQMQLEPWAAFGLFDMVDVGLVVPLIGPQSGQSLSFFNREDSVGGFALGDMRLILKVRLLDLDIAMGFRIALAANIYLPTGDADSFTLHGAARFKPTLAIDWRDKGGGFSVAANIGWLFQPKTTAHNLVMDDSLHWGIGVDVPIVEDQVKILATLHGIAGALRQPRPERLACPRRRPHEPGRDRLLGAAALR